MATVVGIDPSLTSAGVAILRDGQPVHVSHHGYSGHNGASWQSRSRRVRWTAREVHKGAMSQGKPDLVSIEQHPSGVKISAHEFDRSALWHAIFGQFDAIGVPVVVIHPMTLKVWLTGTGRADKNVVIATVAEFWPHQPIMCSDEADALGLGLVGAFHLGDPMPFEVKPRHTTGLEKVAWPEVVKA